MGGVNQIPSDGGARYPVTLTTRQWQIIDATIDNEVSVEMVDLDPRGVADTGRRIREAGWRQVAGWTPTAAELGAWPPDDQVVSVELTVPEWRLVLSWLDRWSSVDEATGDHGQAATSRALRDVVSAQLRQQVPGWS
jgi:hypothetical protein